MIRLYNEGASMKELAERYGVNISTISRTLRSVNKKAPATDQDHAGLVSDVENRRGDDTTDGEA
jgi:transposase